MYTPFELINMGLEVKMPKPIPIFKAPKFEFPLKRCGEIPFTTLLAPNTHLTMLSSVIPFDFRISMVRMNFDNDHNNNVRHYWLCSHNEGVSTTGPPADENVFERILPTSYIIGDNRELRLYPNFYFYGARNFLKLHVHNLNVYTVDINASAYIEEL